MGERKRKLTYWVAPNLEEGPAYSVRARTRREVTAMVFARTGGDHEQMSYGKPRKVTVTYSDAFDLLDQALSEGHHDM